MQFHHGTPGLVVAAVMAVSGRVKARAVVDEGRGTVGRAAVVQGHAEWESRALVIFGAREDCDGGRGRDVAVVDRPEQKVNLKKK